MDSGTPTTRSRLKPLLDFGPLLVFFAVNAKWGLIAATGVLVPLSVVALALSWKLEGRASPVAIFSTVAVVIFGGLTVWLGDESFVKVKLTVIYTLLGGVLAIGLLFKKSLLKELLGQDLRMTEAGWNQLTLRFALFCFFLAALNEVLRRVLSSDDWATFKVFGVVGASLVFMFLQAPLLKRHALGETEP